MRLGPLEAHWRFGSPLLGPHAVDLLIDTICSLRHSKFTGRIIIEVPGLKPGGRDAALLQSAFPSQERLGQDSQASASLLGGMDGWLSRRSGNFRRKLRKAQGAAAQYGVSFERHSPRSKAEASELYRRMLAIEAESWKGALGSGLFAVSRFYGALLQAYAAQGAVRVILARAGEVDIGFCFGGEAFGVYRGQQTSYAEAWKDFSLGVLMHFETAQWLSADKALLQHFGPISPRLSYKESFCELCHPSVQTVIHLQSGPS